MPIWKQRLLNRVYREAADDTGGEGKGGGGTADEQKDDADLDQTDPSDDVDDKDDKDDKNDKGTKKPSNEEARLLKENMKRKEEAKRLKAELEQANALKAAIESLGGLDAIQGLVQSKKDAEAQELEKKGDWERLKERMASEQTKVVEALKSQLTERDNKLSEMQNQLVEITIGAEFARSEFIREDMLMPSTKARRLYGQHFEFEDGKVVGYDKPRGEQNRTPLVNSQGVPLSFDEAFKTIIESDPDKESLLRDKGKSGADSNNRRLPTPKPKVPMTGQERIAEALKNVDIFKM